MIDRFEYERKLSEVGVRTMEKSLLILLEGMELTQGDIDALKELIQVGKELALTGISSSLKEMEKLDFKNN